MKAALVLIAEAALNLRSRAALTTSLAVFIAIGLFVVFASENNSTAAAVAHETSLREKGFNTYLIEPADTPDSPPMHSRDCLALAKVDGVSAAMWMRLPQTVNLHSETGPLTSLWTAGGDTRAMLSLLTRQAAAWADVQMYIDLESSAAGSPGATGSLRIVPASGSGFVVGSSSLRLTGLGAGLAGNAIVIDQSHGLVDVCALYVLPEARQSFVPSVTAALPSLDGYARRWVLLNADEFEPPSSRFDTRASRWTWMVVSVTIAFVWTMNLRLRRGDYAVYAVAGLSSNELAGLAIGEYLILWIGAVFVASAAIGGAIIRAGGLSPAVAVGLAAVGRSIAAGVLAPAAVTWFVMTRRNQTVNSLKDR